MFSLDQKVVYPGHGVAQVSKIFEKQFGQQKITFFELHFLSTEMTVMVPAEKAADVGIRPISSMKTISAILDALTIPNKKFETLELSSSNWNRRNKEYQNKLRTGSLENIADIYKDLKYISCIKELSFGEKNLLQRTETLLVEEISAARNISEDKAIECLRSFFIPVSTSVAVQHV